MYELGINATQVQAGVYSREVISTIQSGTVSEYEDCLTAMTAAAKTEWISVISPSD